MSIMSKIISAILCLTMVVGILTVAPVTIEAAEDENRNAQTELDNVQVTGNNSLGNMLAKEYAESSEEEEAADTGIRFYDIEVVGSMVYVELQTLTDATLVVGIYDEAGKTLLCSGVADVMKDDSIVPVTIQTNMMPDYFVVKTYLMDSETNVPLCKQYENNTYTRTMQAFLSKTTEDFDEAKVLNLDDSEEENFLVYNDDTVIIDSEDGENVVSAVNSETKEYVIENIDETVSNLKPGDIFSYDYGQNEDLLIIKVSNIRIDGTTATITGEETELEDVFEYIRIDASQGASGSDVDNSNLEDEVEYLGEEESDELVGAKMVDQEVISGMSLKYKIHEKSFGKSKLSADISGKFEVKVKCYFDAKLFEKNEVEVSFALKYELKFGAKFEIDLSEAVKIKLGFLGIAPVPGVYVEFTPAFVVGGKASIEFNGRLEGQVGKEFKNGKFHDNSKKAKFKSEVKISATIFIGIAIEPKIGIIGDLLTISVKAKTGVEISAELTYSLTPEEPNPESKHLCTSCVKGKVDFVLELTFEVKLLRSERLSWKANLFTTKIHILDFYYSFDTGKFGFSTCPNKTYRQTVTLTENGKPVKNATVDGTKTDKNGSVKLYLTNGKHTLNIEANGQTLQELITVNGAGQHTVILVKNAHGNYSAPNFIVPPVYQHEAIALKTGKCGDDVYYDLYEDGLLHIYGTGPIVNSGSFSPWDDQRTKIKKVIIDEGVTALPNNAFCQSSNLREVSLPESITSIGEMSFSQCGNLIDIRIPDAVTMIGGGAFYGCSELASINIPSGVAEIQYETFEECSSLTDIVIPDGVTKIGRAAFAYCTKLTVIRIPDSVERIGAESFNSCSGLTDIYIGSRVNTITGGAFGGLSNLKAIHIPNLRSWCECSKKNIICDVPDWDLYLGEERISQLNIPYGTTSVGEDSFDYCKSIQSVTIPGTVKEIGSSAFSRCVSLQDVTISDGVQKIGRNAFYRLPKIKSIYLPDSVTEIEQSAFEDCTNLLSIRVGNKIEIIREDAFHRTAWYDSQPDGFVYIGSCLYAFKGDCPDTVVIPEGTACLAERAFACCTMREVVIPDGITILPKNVFVSCENLTSVVVPVSVTTIEMQAFYNARKAVLQYQGTSEQWAKVTIGIANQYRSVNCLGDNMSVGSPADRYDSARPAESAVAAQPETKGAYEAVGTAGSYSRSGLVPGTEAVLILFRGKQSDYMYSGYTITPTNLLYISQASADENGSVSINPYGDFGNTEWFAVIFGECAHQHQQWIRDEEENCTGITAELLNCEDCGQILDTREVSVTALGHDAETVEEVPATLTQTGLTEGKRCARCGEWIEEPQVIPCLLLGDVNGDREYSVADVTLLQQYLVELENLTDERQTACDSNRDGEINIADATYLQMYLAELIGAL